MGGKFALEATVILTRGIVHVVELRMDEVHRSLFPVDLTIALHEWRVQSSAVGLYVSISQRSLPKDNIFNNLESRTRLVRAVGALAGNVAVVVC